MQRITLEGKDYVVVPRDQYEALAKTAQLPPLPERDGNGNYGPSQKNCNIDIDRFLMT